jgi:hypothetical protein
MYAHRVHSGTRAGFSGIICIKILLFQAESNMPARSQRRRRKSSPGLKTRVTGACNARHQQDTG